MQLLQLKKIKQLVFLHLNLNLPETERLQLQDSAKVEASKATCG